MTRNSVNSDIRSFEILGKCCSNVSWQNYGHVLKGKLSSKKCLNGWLGKIHIDKKVSIQTADNQEKMDLCYRNISYINLLGFLTITGLSNFVSLLNYKIQLKEKPILKIEQDATKFEKHRVNSLVFLLFKHIQDITVQTLLQGRALFMVVH